MKPTKKSSPSLLFMISFHGTDLDETLGGCIVRANSEQEALTKINKAGFPRQVGLADGGKILVTEFKKSKAQLVPEDLVDRLISDDDLELLMKSIQVAKREPLS
jgi:hypothetical protein